MKNIGIIGYGSMGSMLVEGFIKSGFVKQENIIVSTKTKGKLDEVKSKYNQIKTVLNNRDAVEKSDVIFICVKPAEVKNVLLEIKDLDFTTKHLISIAGCVKISNIEKIINCQITKVIPTLISTVGEGVTLICHNKKVSKENALFIESLMEKISEVKIIEEDQFEIITDFTSCAPGLISSILQEFVNAGLKHTRLSEAEVELIIKKTVYGTAKMLIEKNMSFDEAISRVATKGGITEEGVKVLRADLPSVYDKMFTATLDKHEKRKAVIDEDFKKE